MKKFVKIILVLTIICFTACNKQQKEETLQTIENLVEEEPDSALVLINAMKNKRISRYEKVKIILYETIAKDKLDMDISDNIEIFDAAEIILKKGSNVEKAKVLLYASRVCQESNEKEKALFQALQAKEYGFKTENDALKGLILADIGRLNYGVKLYDLSVNNYKEALEYISKTKNYSNQVIILNMIGNIFLLNDNKDSALYYYNAASKIAEETENISLQASILLNIGALYNNYGEYKKSLEQIKKALSISESRKDSLYIYLNMSQTFYSLYDFDSASYYINECINFIENKNIKIETNTYYSVYAILSNIEEKKGNLKTALMLSEKLFDIADSLYSEIAENRLLEIQEKYDYDKVIIANQKLSLQKKNIALFALSITIILLIATFFINKKKTIKEKKLIVMYKKLQKLENSADIYNKKISDTLRSLLLERYEKVDYELFEKIMPYVTATLTNDKEKLSDTEKSICCFYFLGFKKSYILKALNIDTKSFDSSCSRIRRKMGIEKGGSIGLFIAYNLAKD